MFNAAVEIYRGKQSLRRIADDRLSVSAVRDDLAVTEVNITPKRQFGCNLGKRIFADDRRAYLRQVALVEVPVILVNIIGNNDRQNRISQEFQPFVAFDRRFPATYLV